MLDDLDLAWEEQEPRRRRGGPPTRQVRQSRRKEKKRRRRSFGALFISFVLLVALGGGVYWGVGRLQDMFGAPDYDSTGTTQVNVVVKDRATSGDIANELFDKKVVKSAKAFVNAAIADPESKNIQPGTYRLFEMMPAKAALAMLLNPDKNLLVTKVTIQEGLTANQTFAKLSAATKIPVADFVTAAKDPTTLGVQKWWFTRDDGKKSDMSVEGFLFPDTYGFPPGATATEILSAMVDEFNTVTGSLKFADTVQNGLGVTPYEALIVASLSQVEAGNKGDMPKVARVAYNRTVKFKDSFPCACLQFDVAVNYWLDKQGKPMIPSGQMTPAQLDDPKNPWNTGPHSAGLPIGPISNPGKDALQGAMAPPAAAWLYFVAVDKNGTTKFANTLAEHDANVALARKNGVL